jgi:peptide/nickel transport system permease protein
MRPTDATAGLDLGDPIAEAFALDVEVPGRRRRTRRLDPGLALAIVWMVLVVGGAILAGLLPLADPEAIDASAGRQGPSAAHWLGADQLGRDILSRLVYGARVSLGIGAATALAAGVVGTLIGMIAGYFRGAIETISMGALDILLAFPGLVFVIVLTTLFGPTVFNVVLIIAVLSLPAFARVARAQTLAFAQRDFVKAARSIGAGRWRILFGEIAPNIVPTMAAYALVVMAVVIVVEGSLSFLGLGVSADVPTWGSMINGGRGLLETAAHISMIPALVMFLTVLALNTLGEKVRRHYDVSRGLEL